MPKQGDNSIKADLFEAVYTVVAPQLTQEHKAEIIEFMGARGHTMTWNAIR
jgi:hypothetical protein